MGNPGQGFMQRRRRLRSALLRYRYSRVPRGWQTGPPDFVGIGVQRAGTTRWYELIVQHPSIVERRPKELHFFDHLGPVDPSLVDPVAYTRQFPRPPGKLCGEWTPNYLYKPWTIAQLRVIAPEARLLVILRDPVERYRSGLAFWYRKDRRDTFERADERAIDRGRYAEQLQRLFGVFPRGQVLVLQHERCVSEPDAELQKTYGFLGVDDSFRPRWGHGLVINPTKAPFAELDGSERDRLIAIYAEDIDFLRTEVPDFDLGLWPNFKRFA
jgi:hypothetical protein